MSFDRTVRRKYFSHGMTVLTGLSIVVIMIPLIAIIYEAASIGGSVINVQFFTQGIPYPCNSPPAASCNQGGVLVPIEGTLFLLALSALISVPIGIGAAIFAVEYGGERVSARVIGLMADVLSGVPSIVAGAFVWTVMVLYYPSIVYSTLSGSLALSVLMIPIVTRTCEEALRTVPHSVREAALALGISRWKTSMRIVFVAALPGVVTGVLLSIARAAGEAAPLLLTLGNGCPHLLQGLTTPGCSLSIWIFIGATNPYHNWYLLAWGCALLLLMIILILSISSRLVLQRLARRMRGG